MVGMIGTLGTAGMVALVVISLVILIMICILSTWKKVPSDKAAVIVGVGKAKVVTGGGTVLIPILERMDTITLENIMIPVEIKQTKTSLGVPINAEGVVVLKVKNDSSSILTAVQQFHCGKEQTTVENIRTQASEICKGKLREIVSGMSVEEIYNGREKFANTVQEVAGTQLAEMGLELTSFTINDISDNEGYIEALGKEQIAKVKAQAAIAEAQAAKERDIQTAEAAKEREIKTAEARKIGETAKLEADTQIAEASKNKQLKLFEYQKEQETKKADADAAYKIQENIVAKKVTDTQMDAEVLKQQRAKEVTEAQVQIQIVAEQKNIELAKKKAERKEAELQELVIKPAEADLAKQKLDAEARKFEEIKRAEADAERKKLDASAEAEKLKLEGEAKAAIIEAQGKAEADAIRAKGMAEAEALEKKAEALAKMNEAGKLQMVIEKLPEVARAVSEPLAKIGDITIIGGGNGENGASAVDVARMTTGSMKAVMDCMKDVVGFDLSEVMRAQTFEGKTTRNIHVDVTGIEDASDPIKDAIATTIVAEEKNKTERIEKDGI